MARRPRLGTASMVLAGICVLSVAVGAFVYARPLSSAVTQSEPLYTRAQRKNVYDTFSRDEADLVTKQRTLALLLQPVPSVVPTEAKEALAEMRTARSRLDADYVNLTVLAPEDLRRMAGLIALGLDGANSDLTLEVSSISIIGPEKTTDAATQALKTHELIHLLDAQMATLVAADLKKA